MTWRSPSLNVRLASKKQQHHHHHIPKQRQLIAIWRPLCRQSPLAAADEPTLGKWGASFRGEGGKTLHKCKTDGKQGFRSLLHTALPPSTTSGQHILDKVAQGWVGKSFLSLSLKTALTVSSYQGTTSKTVVLSLIGSFSIIPKIFTTLLVLLNQLGIKTIFSVVVGQIFSAVVRGAFWCSLTIWEERGRLCDYVCIRSHCAHAELMQSWGIMQDSPSPMQFLIDLWLHSICAIANGGISFIGKFSL